MQFSGCNVLITGATQGIGRETALQFAKEGAHVCAFARNQDGLDDLLEQIYTNGGSASGYAVDVTDRVALFQTIYALGQSLSQLHIFVHAVGGFKKLLPFDEVLELEWDEVMNLNLKSAFLCSQAVLPWMKNVQSGRMIMLGSIAGLAPNPYAKSYLPYGVAKAGLIGFTKHLAKELGVFGITVNAISPGTTATDRVIQIRGEAALQQLAAANPLNCRIEPQDCAAAILFLASAQAKAITGINLNVNAGSVMI